MRLVVDFGWLASWCLASLPFAPARPLRPRTCPRRPRERSRARSPFSRPCPFSLADGNVLGGRFSPFLRPCPSCGRTRAQVSFPSSFSSSLGQQTWTRTHTGDAFRPRFRLRSACCLARPWCLFLPIAAVSAGVRAHRLCPRPECARVAPLPLLVGACTVSRLVVKASFPAGCWVHRCSVAGCCVYLSPACSYHVGPGGAFRRAACCRDASPEAHSNTGAP